jgi:autotransporter-associated beta strand protein
MDWFTEYTAPNTGALLPTLSFVKNGPATLTLTGSNSYSGTTIINSGLLNVNGASTGAGAFTVNAGGILGGNGSLNSLVTVKSGGSVQPGDVTGNGTLTVNSLTLGTISGDSSALNLAAAAPLSVTAPNGLLINSGVDSVTINVTGTISSIGVVPLIAYSGSLGGTGFSSFQLGSLPPGVQGFLSNDTVKANIDFVATLVTIPRWTGALSSEWSVNVLSPPKNWVQNSDGVTRIDYVDGENVRFDDNAPNPNVSLSVAPVTPASVVISNNTSPYIISGNKAISGAGTLTKQGTGRAVLGTINTYSGNTVIASGTLTLGVTGAVPSGPAAGNVTVNGTLDLNGNSSALNNLSGSGIVDNLVGGHSPVVTAIETSATTFSAGTMQ